MPELTEKEKEDHKEEFYSDNKGLLVRASTAVVDAKFSDNLRTAMRKDKRSDALQAI